MYTFLSACGRIEADIAIALDSSVENNRAHFIEFADMMVQKLEPVINSGSVKISVNTFTNRLRTEFQFDKFSDTSDLLQAIRAIRFRRGRSNVGTSIRMLRDLFARGRGTRQNAPNIAIIVMGRPRRGVNVNDIKRETSISQNRGIETFVLGIGDFKNPVLQAMASKPILRHLFPIEMARVLTEMPEEAMTHLCQGLVQSFSCSL